jgi:hypothetical protein
VTAGAALQSHRARTHDRKHATVNGDLAAGQHRVIGTVTGLTAAAELPEIAAASDTTSAFCVRVAWAAITRTRLERRKCAVKLKRPSAVTVVLCSERQADAVPTLPCRITRWPACARSIVPLIVTACPTCTSAGRTLIGRTPWLAESAAVVPAKAKAEAGSASAVTAIVSWAIRNPRGRKMGLKTRTSCSVDPSACVVS